jgi:hypothetical protein
MDATDSPTNALIILSGSLPFMVWFPKWYIVQRKVCYKGCKN